MHAEIIAIGDELTSGQRLNTNSHWLSDQLGMLGIATHWHTTVGDDLERIVAAMRTACERCEIVLVTGGLGPTDDDLTRQAIAALLNAPLQLDEASLVHIESLFQSRHREMPEKNRIQAMLPAGSTVIPNPHGTAPGIAAEIVSGGKTAKLYAFPGVPAEMQEMYTASVVPPYQAVGGTILHRSIKIFGIGESEVERRLPELIARTRSPLVGITASKATITLRITATGSHAEDCAAQMEPSAKLIYETLGDLIFGEGEDELQHAVLRQLADRGQTLATAEFTSAGLMSQWLAEADAGQGYCGGWLAPRLHSVDATERKDSKDNGPNDAELLQLAQSTRSLFAADWGLVLGPFPNSAGKDNRVAVAVVGDGKEEVIQAPFAGHPDILAARSVKHALDALRQRLHTN